MGLLETDQCWEEWSRWVWHGRGNKWRCDPVRIHWWWTTIGHVYKNTMYSQKLKVNVKIMMDIIKLCTHITPGRGGGYTQILGVTGLQSCDLDV